MLNILLLTSSLLTYFYLINIIIMHFQEITYKKVSKKKKKN